LAILQASYTVGSKVYDIFDSLIARGAWTLFGTLPKFRPFFQEIQQFTIDFSVMVSL
jgi:hypothetical protein